MLIFTINSKQKYTKARFVDEIFKKQIFSDVLRKFGDLDVLPKMGWVKRLPSLNVGISNSILTLKYKQNPPTLMQNNSEFRVKL